jgi:LuxR family maltose regulon positive regulatory protein
VPRPRLLAKLRGSTAPVVLLCAPSGYGKSVLLEQWAQDDPREFTSIILGDAHNDPVLLLTSILDALERIEPLSADVVAALHVPKPSIERTVLPRLGRALGEREVPVVLALDDLEQIESPQSLSVVASLAGLLPPGSRLALACRTEPALPIGRLRAHRLLFELGRADLTMTKSESQALLAGLGIALNPRQLDLLVRHTEGWPAALYLAGLVLSEEPDLGRALARFAGDDRIVVDYIREEFLGPLSRRRLDFMRRASVLDRLSGELCDAVLQRTGSGQTLIDLSRSNTLLTPLDRSDRWFRFHSLLGETLRAELHRIEPAMEGELNLRASLWWEEQGDWDRAIQYAIDAGATERAGTLLWKGVPRYMTRGRVVTVIGWLDRIGEETIASEASLSMTACFAAIIRGAGSLADHWAAVARSLMNNDATPAEDLALLPGLALAEAALARDGLQAMCARTEAASGALADESAWLSMCCMLDGVGLHLRGFREAAHGRLTEGARRGSVGAPTIQVLALAQLALLAIEDGDWQLAEILASQSRAQINRSGLLEYPMVALAMGVSAMVDAQLGRVEKAAKDLRLGTDLLEELDEFAPWYEVEARIVLARCASRLDDGPQASALIGPAKELLKRVPDDAVLGEWVDRTALDVEALQAADIGGLSPAELRVLQFLPGHLSYPAIAAQTFVSPNTVKTQAQSIYRKLGASSRSQAVELAKRAGLLGA